MVLRQPSFAELLELAVAQPRRYGAADPDLLSRIFTMLREIAWTAGGAIQRAAVAEQLDLLTGTAERQQFDRHDHNRLEEQGKQVRHALAGTWEQ